MTLETLKTLVVGLDSLKVGMIVSKNVVSKKSKVLVQKNKQLSQSEIDLIKENELLDISVYSNSDLALKDTAVRLINNKFTPQELKQMAETGSVKDPNVVSEDISNDEKIQIEKLYLDFTRKIEKIFASIGEGRRIDMNGLSNISVQFIAFMENKGNIFETLSHLREMEQSIYTHSLNVSIMANIFGSWLGYNRQTITNLTLAGLLHDVGEARIDDKILSKTDRLTIEEYEEIKKHPYLGFQNILHYSEIHQDVKDAVLQHHERLDGSGYPVGLEAKDISGFVRIISICDIYEAMTADRAYRDRVCAFSVFKKLEEYSMTTLDPKLVKTFLENIAHTYIGSTVQLSDRRVGEVIFINPADLSKPIVKLKHGEYIDLSKLNSISIKRILS